MGSCVSRSAAAAAVAGSGRQGVATAKVVGMDGSVARYAAPVTAREALGWPGGSDDAPCFVCSSDELRFDAPARALGAEEPLHAGQLYFVLPASMLRRALSGSDMAALAVRASAALAASAGESSSRRKVGDGAAGTGDGKQRRASRVAPLVVVSSRGSNEGETHGQEWYQHHAYGKYGTRKTVHGGDADETVGKARKGAGQRSGGARHPAGVQRLSAIPEASD